jgi:uncharacterized glyoxalase superfamily protein PhnB
MKFYHVVLGGSLGLQTLAKQDAPRPAGPGDRITHSRLQADGVVIIASDGHTDCPTKVGDNIDIAPWAATTRVR